MDNMTCRVHGFSAVDFRSPLAWPKCRGTVTLENIVAMWLGGRQVRHPGVGRAISRDFALMVGVARVAELLPSMRRLRLQDSLKQFAAPLREQARPPARPARP